MDGGLILAAVLMQGATAYDVETTFQAKARCATCYEGNPMMRSLNTKPKMYAVDTVANAVALFGAAKLKHKSKAWVIVPALIVGAHAFAGLHNSKQHTIPFAIQFTVPLRR